MPPQISAASLAVQAAWNALSTNQQNWVCRQLQAGMDAPTAVAQAPIDDPTPTGIEVVAGIAKTIVLVLAPGATQTFQISDQSTTPPTNYTMAVNTAFLTSKVAPISTPVQGTPAA